MKLAEKIISEKVVDENAGISNMKKASKAISKNLKDLENSLEKWAENEEEGEARNAEKLMREIMGNMSVMASNMNLDGTALLMANLISKFRKDSGL
jgi:bifunctional DNA-binding transcriptional regulator/antitoxin component of YhaV-PrlF toxin-antitoxin module